ncbi:efflux transporter outer membrane subunit [Phenylobacterium soli]|uniref:RND transporter n=1 Tax=Phenylobacterium soli TaxID=2170551 RepID=A0A328APA8_9CAUL|nr:efflux transporter outer membrane subunit [Phenylobacterium soli]RAK54688.1 RND transporter [Phenylobacterium soli]
MSLSNSPLRFLAVSASALALSACAAVGPNFKAPEGPKGPAASGYAMKGDAAAPGVRLSPDARAAGPWWQAFGSPELDQVMAEALAGSPTLAEADATLQRAQQQAAAVRGAQLPQVDLNGSAQREHINLQAFGFSGFPGMSLSNPTINLYSVGGAVGYDLDLFGGRRRASEAAGARADAAARQADAAYLTLSGNVAIQAVRVASLRSQIAAAQQVIAEDRRVLDMIRAAQKAGAEAPSATSGGEAQLAEDEALLPPLQRDLDSARHQLALLVGKSPAEWAAPDFDIARFTAPADVPVSLPSELVRKRPDILAAEAQLHAATADIGVAVANQYPDVRLSANLTQSSLKPENLFNYKASGWQLLSGVTAPIFHGGTLKAQRKGAEAEARAALARYQATVIRAFVQVSDVLAALAADQQQIAALKRAETSSAASARDAQTAYRLGGGTLMQVIDAQRTLSRARRASAQAEGQRLADLVQLYTATAADWRSTQTAAR